VFYGGYVYDPDLTEIGDEVVLGGGSVICAHAVNLVGPRKCVFISAPIHICERVTIGGGARVAMGVTIGKDAVVEAGSNVVAMTHIPAGEVWGGNPAVFLRKRWNKAPGDGAAETPRRLASADAVAELHSTARTLVERALSLPAGTLRAQADDAEDGWDSLDCLAIGAAFHDTYRCQIPIEQVIRLRSLADVARILRQVQAGQQGTASSPVSGLQPEPVEPAELPSDPEWLPLLPSDVATQRLNQAGRPATNGEPICVTVAASFTAELLRPSLDCWSAAFGIAAQIDFCDFNQVARALLDPQSLFHRNRSGLNVVLFRPEDLPAEDDAAEEAVSQLLGAMRQFVSSGGRSHLVVGSLPPPVSLGNGISRSRIDALRSRWSATAAQLPGVEILDFAGIVERIGTVRAADLALEAVARAPYSADVYRELGIALARCLRKRRRPSAKVLALDCDGVFWGGVIGEDGIDGLQLGADGPGRAFQWMQKTILDLKKRGVLLVLVSRNQERDVFEVFDNHPGMLVRREDLAGWRINLNPKSQNLRELAAELNLGLDAFVFVDDDPVQRLHVQSHLPQVHVFPMPADPVRYAESLCKLWIFDTTALTFEDSARTEMLRQERLRQQSIAATESLDGYLEGLRLRVEMRAAQARDLPRVAQLTQKTNQFNLSLRRRTLEEIQGLAGDYRTLVLSASDRFGDYGQIGACILRRCKDATEEIDTFLLSCRALGRGVEQAMLHGVFELARRGGTRILRAPLVVGPRNEPARSFFAASGFRHEAGDVLVADADLPVALPKHVNMRLETRDAVGNVGAGPGP
jgi:FkbH-like protein